MKFNKLALSQQQLIVLMQQRGLPLAAPDDVEIARRALDRIGYFRLSGFMLPFTTGGGGGNRHNFRAGATITKIVGLHDFDGALRLHCLDALAQIEVAMRASICDHLSRSYGPHWPLAATPFKQGKHVDNLLALAKAVEYDIYTAQPYPKQTNAHQFISKYYAKYSAPKMPPAWMVRECASFRTWAFVFEALNSPEQKQISDVWKYPSGKRIDHAVLENWFHSLSILRNRCAHHARIIHKSFPFAPTIPQDGSVAHLFRQPATDLRALIAVMAILVRCIDPKSVWLRRLHGYFEWQREVDLGTAVGLQPWGQGDWQHDPLWTF